MNIARHAIAMQAIDTTTNKKCPNRHPARAPAVLVFVAILRSNGDLE